MFVVVLIWISITMLFDFRRTEVGFSIREEGNPDFKLDINCFVDGSLMKTTSISLQGYEAISLKSF
jgi:hypothetical protein